MQGWIILEHDSFKDFIADKGTLIGSFYSDIESACRALVEDGWIGGQSPIVSAEPHNGFEKYKITLANGKIYGAYLCKMPMRADMPMYERG